MKTHFLFSAILLYTAGLAAQETWNVDANGTWGNSANWTPATVPNGVGVSATFGNKITATRTVTLDLNVTVGALAFDNFHTYNIVPLVAQALTISNTAGSGTITLTNVNGNGTHFINTPITLSSNMAISSTIPTGLGALFLGGVVSGPGSVTILGSGTSANVVMGASNTYMGGTTITSALLGFNIANALPSSGTVTLGSNGVIDCNGFAQSIGNLAGVSSGSVDFTGTTLTVNTTATSSYAGILTGSLASTLTIQGNGVLSLTGATGYSDNIVISSGTLQIGFANALDFNVNVAVNSPGVFDLNGFSQAISNLTGNGKVTLDTASTVLTVFPASNPDTFSGSISGPGSLVKTGGFTLALTGVSNFTGGTTVIAGPLQLGVNNALSPIGPVALNGGTLDISPASAQTIGTLSGTGNINMGGAALSVNGLANAAYGGVMSNTPGSFIYLGPATLMLNGVNLYTGGTTINGGIVQLGTGLLPPGGDLAINSPGIFDLNGHNQTIGALSGNGNMTLGAGTVTMNTAKTSTYSGAISGGGAVIFQGPGMLTMLGPNSYLGGTTVSGGTLEGNTLSLQGNINNTATLVFNQTSPGTFSGALTGAGALVIAGSSPLTLLGPQTQGTTAVNSGELIIGAGANLTSLVTVAGGATLSGSGTITGNVTNQGTVELDFNNLTITGNYNQAAGSFLSVAVTPTQNGLLSVSGTVAIDTPSTVEVFPQRGSYGPETQYTIITAQGGPVTGTFSDVVVSNPFFIGTLLYNDAPGNVDLVLSFAPFSNVIKKGNAGKIAKCIQPGKLNRESDLFSIVQDLIFLPIPEITAALNEMQPSELTALKLIEENNLMLAQAAISQRLDDIDRTPCNVAMSKAFTWNPWMNVGADFLNQDRQGSSQGIDATTVSGALGVDRRFTNTLIGLAGAYNHSSVDWNNSHGKGMISSYYVGPYLTYFKHRFYLNLSGLAAFNAYRSSRHIKFQEVNRHATSSHRGHGLNLHTDIGVFLYPAANMTLTPFIAGSYLFLHEGSYSEKGARSLNLKIASSHADLVLSELGLKVAKCAVRKRSKWTHDLKLSWIHAFPFHGEHLTAHFPAANCSFTVKGMEPNRDYVDVATGLTAIVLKDRLSIALRYEGKFGDGITDNTGYFQVTGRF
jgi:fibronectin-binding autotransporter adhesin